MMKFHGCVVSLVMCRGTANHHSIQQKQKLFESNSNILSKNDCGLYLTKPCMLILAYKQFACRLSGRPGDTKNVGIFLSIIGFSCWTHQNWFLRKSLPKFLSASEQQKTTIQQYHNNKKNNNADSHMVCRHTAIN